MKRTSIIIAAALLLASAAASGQEKAAKDKFELNVGLNGVNGITILTYAFTNIGHNTPDDGMQDKAEFALPLGLSIEGRYDVAKWFEAGLNVNFQYFGNKITGEKKEDTKIVIRDKDGQEKAYKGYHSFIMAAIMPEVRFNYMKKDLVTLFGHVEGGVALYMMDKGCSTGSGPVAAPCFQVNPLGITIGRKHYGYIEVGYGTLWQGVQAGYGVRF